MTILSDGEITEALRAGLVGIEPYDPARLNPASVDLTLGADIRRFNRTPYNDEFLDFGDIQPNHTRFEGPESRDRNRTFNGRIILQPGELILGCTVEVVRVPDSMIARVEGKSSLGRAGLSIHITAGFIDPGFEGHITLEIKNEQPHLPMLLVPGMLIGQIAFDTMGRSSERSYGLTGHYQGQRGPVESRFKHPAVASWA